MSKTYIRNQIVYDLARYWYLFTEGSSDISVYSGDRGVHIVLTGVGRKQESGAEKECEQHLTNGRESEVSAAVEELRNMSLTAGPRGDTSACCCCWRFNCSPVSLGNNLAVHTVTVCDIKLCLRAKRGENQEKTQAFDYFLPV